MTQPSKPSPLGRGLSALFGDADASYTPKATAAPATVSTLTPRAASPVPATTTNEPVKSGSHFNVQVSWLQSGKYQPRRHFDDAALQGLATSIKERGVIEPLVIRALDGQKDRYEIIAGERRWRAAQIAGLHEVPAVVRSLTDREALEFGLIENIQRQDLSPLEEAEGYKRLIEEFKHTHEGLANIVGKSRPHVSNMMRLLNLPPEVRAMVDSGELSVGHARTVLTAKDPLALAKIIVSKGLNARQAEDLAKRELEAADPKKAKAKSQVDFAVGALEQDLSRISGFKIKIVSTGKGGKFTIHYNDLDQLDVIIKRIKGL